MPAVRTYVVRQEREVVVRTIGPAEAITFANKVFNQEAVSSDEGSVVREVRVTDITARED